MTATASEHRLLIGGEQVETGEWVEVESPFSGEVIGRVAKGGAAETRRALDAAAAALAAPLPAYERANILDRVAHLLEERQRGARRDDLGRGGKAAEDGPRRSAARGVDLHVRRRRGAQADRRDGADGRLAGRRRQAGVHPAPPDRDRRRHLAVQLPGEPGRSQDRAGARGRLPGRAQAGVGDSALGALPRESRGGGRPAARLDQRRRRPGRRDR